MKNRFKFLLFIALANSAMSQQPIPFAPGIKDSITNNALWTDAMVVAHAKATIADPGPASDIPTRDNAAKVGLLAFQSSKVETLTNFSGKLDLNSITDSVKVSILVDDKATFTVESDNFKHYYEVNGSALWRAQSFKMFEVVLEPKKIYNLSLTYKNTANLSNRPAYAGKTDVDGINIYLSKADASVWNKKKESHKAEARIGARLVDGAVVFVNGFMEYDVCWEEKKNALGVAEYRNLQWILTNRPVNQAVPLNTVLIDRRGQPIKDAAGKTIVTKAGWKWSIKDIGSTTVATDDMAIEGVRYDYFDFAANRIPAKVRLINNPVGFPILTCAVFRQNILLGSLKL
jgi:hypothetical protein